MQLITNRSQRHVELLNRLRKKRWVDMTASEKTLWYNEAALGAYNHTDLNRVETVVAFLAPLLDLTLTTKTNWTYSDVPTESDMTRYLSNVKAVRDACSTDEEFPTLPDSMNNLTYEMANNIEKTLDIVCRVSPAPISTLGLFTLGVSTLASD